MAMCGALATTNLILHGMFNQRILHGEGGKNTPFLTTKLKAVDHQIWHAGCRKPKFLERVILSC